MNQHPRDTICANFQEKLTALTFSAQICPKKFRKLMTGLELASSRYSVCQFSVKIDNFDLFVSNLPKNEF